MIKQKRILSALLVNLCLCLLFTTKVSAQDQEIQQLLLNTEKLTMFKQLLNDMKTGYEVVMKGYTAVRDVSQGNFSLHKVFLDGLLEVSPSVRNYKKVADIISLQLRIVSEYKSAFTRFKTSSRFNSNEISYIGSVYDQLFNQSLKNLDDLTTIITSGSLRMSDDERLAGIDRIYDDTEDKLQFLRSFNSNTSLLDLQRAKASNEVNSMRSWYGLP